MTKLYLIAAVDEEYAIGCENHLLYHLSADLKQFKEKTSGKCVIMGRKTLESLPGGRPLRNRRNIVLSHSIEACSGIEVCHSFAEVMEIIQDEQEVWVIGGESIYRLFLPYADAVCLTHIHKKAVQADTYFPELTDCWICTFCSGEQEENGIVYHFSQYEKGTR